DKLVTGVQTCALPISMLVKKTSSLRCTRALLRVDPSRALNVWRNVAIASPSGLILIVSVSAISFLRSRVAHRTQSRLRAVHVERSEEHTSELQSLAYL